MNKENHVWYPTDKENCALLPWHYALIDICYGIFWMTLDRSVGYDIHLYLVWFSFFVVDIFLFFFNIYSRRYMSMESKQTRIWGIAAA